MDWSRALKAYRRRHVLTQAALSEILNVDPTTVTRWERGRDQPAVGIQRRLRSLMTPAMDVERTLKQLIDTSEAIAVLYDSNYRVLYSSAKHRALLGLDASELYGRSYERFHSETQAALMASLGGTRGWLGNGIASIDYTLMRRAYERARNPRAYAQRGTTWTIRDRLDSPLVLGITHEIPIAEYAPSCSIKLSTLDDPIG